MLLNLLQHNSKFAAAPRIAMMSGKRQLATPAPAGIIHLAAMQKAAEKI